MFLTLCISNNYNFYDFGAKKTANRFIFYLLLFSFWNWESRIPGDRFVAVAGHGCEAKERRNHSHNRESRRLI